ncbi:MAG: DnaJ domain-containing protein [Polyangiaceae bacterium]|nr:DnaJ domain-containing protein [Polyangiaceae bacterium]
MSDKLDALDYYTLLGVSDDAEVREIKRAFRRFARRYHPDQHVDAPADKREKAMRIYRRGSEAYQVLTDPPSRKAYDEALRRGMVRLTEDVRDRVAPVDRRPKAPVSPIRSREALARFRQAVALADANDWLGAWKALSAADAIEPGNPFIEERLLKAEGAVRKMRR